MEKTSRRTQRKRKAEIGSCFIGTKKQLDEKVRKSLYEQVKIISVATIIFLIVLFLTIIFYFSQDRRILITRDETGGEVTEQQIRIKTKSDDDIYTLEIHPKGYTKAQITQAFDRGEAYLRKHLVAKNKSLNEVERNLEMPVKIPGENIAVQWQSGDPTVIDEEGNVFSKNVKKDYLLNLDARMECQGEVRILKIPVCVVPGNSGKKVSEKQKIIADLKKLEEKHITKEQFYLPDVIRQGRLLPAENESQIPAILFLGIAVIIFFWYHENEKYKEQRIQTLEQSMVEYPQIIERLILFLGTGMSVVAALEAVATEYEKEQKRRKQKRNTSYMNRSKKHADRFHFGVPQTKAFGEMGKRLGCLLIKIICSARTEYYKRFNGSVSKVKRRGRRSVFLRKKNMQKGKENKQAQNCSHR